MSIQRMHYKTGAFLKCCSCSKEIYKTPTQIKRSKSKKYFCSKSCQTKWRNTQYVGKKHKNWKDGYSRYRKILLDSTISQVCLMCREKDVRVLAVHHIDQDHKNVRMENLAWLCHNCHHLVRHDSVSKQKFSKVLILQGMATIV
jgi:hypothetical protein